MACGYVFGSDAEAQAGTPAASTPSGVDDAAVGADLYDPGPMARLATQVAVLAALSALLAVVTGTTAALDTADSLDVLGDTPTVFLNETGDISDVAGRTDLWTLSELSLLAGVLVLLGGWAQQAAADRSLLDVSRPRYDSRAALLAFAVPGVNVVLAPRVFTELWHDATPPDLRTRGTPTLVHAWRWLFPVGVGARLAVLVWGFTLAPIPDTDADAVVAGVAVAGARLLWIAALAVTVPTIRALGRRQCARAEVLSTDGAR